MDVGGVREALHKQPFEPFVVCLADGRTLPDPSSVVDYLEMEAGT